MRQGPIRTVARPTAVLAAASLVIGLLGTLAPAGQASVTHRPVGPAITARVPAAIRALHRLAGATKPAIHHRPAIKTVTGLARALSRAPLTDLALPALIKWKLSHLDSGSSRPAADEASSSSGSITGTVTGDGHPLGHICVLALGVRDAADPLKMTVTAKTGRYQLRGLHAGRYDVSFLADGDPGCPSNGNWLEQWYPGVDISFPNHKVVAVPVRPGKLTKGINGKLRHGAEITGIIRDKARKPLSGLCALTLGFGKSDVSLAEGSSDRSGRYVLGGLFPGLFIVSFMVGCGTKRDYAFQWWRHTNSILKAAVIKVTARQVVSGIDPVMLPGAAVFGKVRGGSTRGKPVSRVCITVGGLDELLGSETVTGKKGAFKIEGLGTGSYTLRFDPTCNFDQVSPYLKASRKFRVTGGHDRHLGIVPLRVGARLTGVVRDSSGHRLAGVCVDVEDRGIDHAKTGPNGTYSIVGIGPGKDAVSFSSCSTATSVVGQFYNDRPIEQTANKITFRAGKTVSGIDATMQPAGTLTGLVTDRSGRPLARVCVGIVSAGTADLIDSGFVRSIRTSPNGRYVLRNITPGPYQVSIGCDGGYVAPRWFDNQQDSTLGNFLSIAGGQVTTLDGKVGPPGAIAGDVTSQSRKPLGNICVEIADAKTRNFIDNNPGGIGPRVTVHGHYQIGGLTPGRYLVNFSECGGGKWADQWYRNGTTIASARAVTVRPGQTTTGINQVLADGGLISGTVTDSSGQPVRNICVQAFDPASLGFGEAATGRTGHYTISGLDSGQYSVYFAPCSVKGANLGGASARTLVTVTRPRTTTVNIKLKAGGTISGKVLGGANGKAPQAGTCVLAVPNDPNGSLQPVVTRNDGTYLLPDLAPGKYRLYFGDLYCINLNFFSSPEATTAPQWFQNQAAEAAATTITVTSGHTNTGINATMHQYGTISGTVRTPSNGPVSGECVTAVPTEPQFDQAFDEPIPDVSAITTAAGRYTLIALPGQYKIKFSAGCGDSGFATQWWNGASSAKTAQLVTVAYGTTKGIDATLHH